MDKLLDRLEKIYEWIAEPNPPLVDVIYGIVASIIVFALITLIGMGVFNIFGWYLAPITGIIFVIALGVYFLNVQKNYDGGIKQWWKDKP